MASVQCSLWATGSNGRRLSCLVLVGGVSFARVTSAGALGVLRDGVEAASLRVVVFMLGTSLSASVSVSPAVLSASKVGTERCRSAATTSPVPSTRCNR